MNKVWRWWYVLILFGLAACSPGEGAAAPPLVVGGLWDVPVNQNGQALWDAAAPVAQEQHIGWAKAGARFPFEEVTYSEGNRNDDVQTAVRALAEGNDRHPPALALLGATSNEASARAVALANFFNLPLLIPGISGDNLLPEGNQWAFQLSAANADYAHYLLNTVLTRQTIAPADEAGNQPEVRIAILYERNTYGETAAVSLASAALEQAYEIVLYDKFPDQDASPTQLRALANQALDEEAQLIFLVSSQPESAQALAQTFIDLSPPNNRPLLVGLAAGFLSQQFAASPQAEQVYVVRQRLDTANCPEAVQTSFHAAQTYAALVLLQEGQTAAAETASANAPLSIRREALRDALKNGRFDLPCLGEIAFDNRGKNKLLRFEIVSGASVVPTLDFIHLVQAKLRSTP